ncbi:hypothetical protein I7I53_04666 [Histoplasma capsulatum var. duboisii H88]|uniref:Uncharacterized protein n=1 Tax=Ajellomyces capsulatus (strain H88) TaxID=544711 RepID=A0A8A1LWD3_AJEC8|nr:hypothetical protein I7I53_04666 [Histoplasma capsulatum var. duboisii H88]
MVIGIRSPIKSISTTMLCYASQVHLLEYKMENDVLLSLFLTFALNAWKPPRIDYTDSVQNGKWRLEGFAS